MVFYPSFLSTQRNINSGTICAITSKAQLVHASFGVVRMWLLKQLLLFFSCIKSLPTAKMMTELDFGCLCVCVLDFEGVSLSAVFVSDLVISQDEKS